MLRMKTIMLIVLINFLFYHFGFTQTAPVDSQKMMQKALRVYMDCDICDMDYIRTEISYVNYVRDRHDAQVHVLITTQSTGSGGTEFTVTFLGKQNFAHINDTLKYVSEKSATSDDIRKGLVRSLKLGLVRYVSHTPVADKLSVHFQSQATNVKVKDKWNNWVYGISANTFAQGQKSTNSLSIYGRVYANHVTTDWKIRFSLSGSYNESNFEINDTTTISSFTRSKNVSFSVVKSLTDHWSAAVFADYSTSTYSNLKHRVRLSPAIEYNIFPYSESTRRELRIDYGLRTGYVDYLEKTIYYKNWEYLNSHYISVTLSLKQTWGSAQTSIDASQFLHDLSKNRLQLFSYVQLRLFSGFSLNIFGNISRIHDQLGLPLAGASQEEVLLRRRELATTYSYFISFGFSYTFGSIYSNIVNPRFGSGGGGYRFSFSM